MIMLSFPKNKTDYNSLSRRGYSLPILTFLSSKSSDMTFGKIMEKLNISKRGLSLTLNDLENDGLIKRDKIGRKSFVSITSKGISVVESFSLENTNSKIIDKTLNATVKQLEVEGIISSDWTNEDREEFIEKLKKSITDQINKVERL